jgi:DNA-binding response OmpR family regulator
MKKILFVEDEAALQEAFGEVLKQAGYEVIMALDGEIALRLAKSEKPDLIMLDLVLPKVHGFDVLKRLKKDKETENIPVIVLTNLEKAEDVDTAIELGAKTYLVKTQYNLEEVIDKIKKVIKD